MGNDEVYIVDNKYLWSPIGIGGDDRAGVHILYWISKSEYKNKVNYLFTKGEERGCQGARSFNIDFKDKLDIFAMIEFDREGRDFVMYRYRDKEWEEYITKITGRKSGIGSLSDISYLDMGVRGVNIGIGYYNNHSGSGEFVVINDMIRAFVDGKALIADILEKGKKWEYKEITYRYFGYDFEYDLDIPWWRRREERETWNDFLQKYDWFVLRYTDMCKSCSNVGVDIFTSEKDGISLCINCISENYDILYFNDFKYEGYANGRCNICGKIGRIYINTTESLPHCENCIAPRGENIKAINRIRAKNNKI
jgi:hypothetical protein